jgi:hypothetical protein
MYKYYTNICAAVNNNFKSNYRYSHFGVRYLAYSNYNYLI